MHGQPETNMPRHQLRSSGHNYSIRSVSILSLYTYLLPVGVVVAAGATLQAGDQLVAPGNHLGIVHSGMWVGLSLMPAPDPLVPSYHLAGATDPLVDPLEPVVVGVQPFQCGSQVSLAAVFVLALVCFLLVLYVAQHAYTQPTTEANNT